MVIRFLTELPGSKANNHVKGGEESRPASLTTRKHLCRREVLLILVVRDHVDHMVRRLEIVSPGLGIFEDGEQILIVSVVVELGTSYGATEERDGVNLTILSAYGELVRRIPAMAFSEDSVSTTGKGGGSNWWRMGAEVKTVLRRPHIAATRPTGGACA
jgi:hypothetical protein